MGAPRGRPCVRFRTLSCPHPDSRNSSMRMIAIGLAAMSFAACGSAAAPSSEANPDIDWTIQRHGTQADGEIVQFNVESHWGPNSTSMWGSDTRTSELQGLSPTQVTGATGPVRFAIVREAGRLDCSGLAGRLIGNGSCAFTADAGFVDFLATHGMGRPTPHHAYTLTM